jgi:hypothetical protein
MLNEALRLAAECLRGEPSRPIRASDVHCWREAHLLLPIADAMQRRGTLRTTQWSTSARDMLAAVQRLGAATEAAERHAVREVLSTLRNVTAGVLLLKGVALSYTVYPAPWLRARSDIDLMVPPGSMLQVASALQSSGFLATRESTHPLVTRQRHFTRQRGLRVALDVHETLVNPVVFRTLPEFDVLCARAQPVPMLAEDAKALSTPDALLHALVHRVAHHNSSIDVLWLYDMHLLVDRMDARHWATLLETAEQSQVARIALDGLDLLVATFGSTVPAAVMQRLGMARGEASAALLGGELTEWQLQWINFKSLPNLRERAAFVRAHVAPPASDLPFDRHASWRLPFGYVARVMCGVRKWTQPISRVR